MPGSGINTKRDLLFVATAAIEQLQCEQNHLDHFGLARLEQEPGFSWLTGHEGMLIAIEHVHEQDVYLLSESGALRQGSTGLSCWQHRPYPSGLLITNARAPG